jgi:hypothetical protein
MAKAPIKTISDKLAKVNDNFSVNMYDNGFMIEVSGQDGEENWESAKIMCSTVEELTALIQEVTNMERV